MDDNTRDLEAARLLLTEARRIFAVSKYGRTNHAPEVRSSANADATVGTEKVLLAIERLMLVIERLARR